MNNPDTDAELRARYEWQGRPCEVLKDYGDGFLRIRTGFDEEMDVLATEVEEV
jgi:hypothetical protein